MTPYAESPQSQEEPARSTLAHYLERAQELVPTAEEGESYGMKALRYRGRPLVSVIATKAGYSVYPFSPEVVELVISTLEGFESTKGGIRFTQEQLLPDEAFDTLVTARRDEIDSALDRAK